MKARIRSVSRVTNDTLAKMRGLQGNAGTVRVTVCSKQDPEFTAEADVWTDQNGERREVTKLWMTALTRPRKEESLMMLRLKDQQQLVMY